MKEISIENLFKLNNPIIIDIRKKNNYIEDHIPSAINIPYMELITEYPILMSKSELYFICCDQGITGKEVCTYLSKLGYNTINIIGGYEAYKNYKNL